MSGKANRTSKFAATILIISNFITMIFCITLFAFSLWIVASPSTFCNFVQIFGNPTLKSLLSEDLLSIQLGIGGALVSCFFFSISFMGLYGAITGSQFLLFMYATLVLLLLLLECAIMYYISSNLLEKGIQEPKSQLSHFLRTTLHCCDHNYTIPSLNDTAPPWSCCKVDLSSKNCTIDKAYTLDCYKATINWLDRYETPIYVVLAVFHILLSSCSLLRRALRASHSHS